MSGKEGVDRPGSVPPGARAPTAGVDIQLSGTKPCTGMVARFIRGPRDVQPNPTSLPTRWMLSSLLRGAARCC